jgi:antirestriction protein ArdC
MGYKKSGKTAKEVHEDIVKSITDKFLACLDQGKIPWKQPWNSKCNGFIKADGKCYNFMNTFMLIMQGGNPSEYVTMAEIHRRSGLQPKDPKVWSLFNREADGSIPKPLRVYGYPMRTLKEKDPKTGKLVDKLDENGNPIVFRSHHITSFSVWEVGRQVNVPLKFNKKVKEFKNNPIAECEMTAMNYLSREGIKLTHNASRAYYSPTTDEISLPSMTQFFSSELFYGSLYHEMAHSTGADSRLKRNIEKRDRESYSMEELVAEITACMLLHDQGVSTDATDKDSVSYVQGWAKALRSDPEMVAKACAYAETAANFIYNGKNKK